ncbi:nuclear transport factor 2 family protein [Nocardia sp. NPDC023852]|uniref:nuclear transport factor 2 family protein n=1 Tax=Nocardia sp. NPDC023852 TaxID=3154697 RepID=UPI0033F0FBBE
MVATEWVETSRELVENLFGRLRHRDADAFVELFAPDAVFEIPFVVPGIPARLEGRDAIRDHLVQRWSGLSGIEVHGVHPQVYETTDPEVFLVENEVDMTHPGAERARVRTSVNVIRVRGGKVVLFRDYLDTARFAGLAARCAGRKCACPGPAALITSQINRNRIADAWNRTGRKSSRPASGRIG